MHQISKITEPSKKNNKINSKSVFIETGRNSSDSKEKSIIFANRKIISYEEYESPRLSIQNEDN